MQGKKKFKNRPEDLLINVRFVLATINPLFFTENVSKVKQLFSKKNTKVVFESEQIVKTKNT